MTFIRCETGEDVEVPGDTLVGAKISHRNLHRALLENADLRGADLTGSTLRSARLEGANFENARLFKVNFAAAEAKGANFHRANLAEAFLGSAGFESASFTLADLSGADVGRSVFRGADFRGADMRCEDLLDADLRGAIADGKTVWPGGYDPGARGVSIVNDIPLYSVVRLATDRHQAEGARRGMVGTVIEAWADGTYDVEFSDSSGVTVAQIVVTAYEIVPTLGP